eukprot:5629174-Amphidinium_carterae.1
MQQNQTTKYQFTNGGTTCSTIKRKEAKCKKSTVTDTAKDCNALIQMVFPPNSIRLANTLNTAWIFTDGKCTSFTS